MKVLVWVTGGTWSGCIDAIAGWLPGTAQVTLLHVSDDVAAAAAERSHAALMGRGGAGPAERLRAEADAAGQELLAAAAARLGRDVEREQRFGRIEREVVEAADGFDLLVCARDGDHERLGPHSLGHHTRFVVDHAPCIVVLVWPDQVPGLESIPPPPPHDHPHGPHDHPHGPHHHDHPHPHG